MLFAETNHKQINQNIEMGKSKVGILSMQKGLKLWFFFTGVCFKTVVATKWSG